MGRFRRAFLVATSPAETVAYLADYAHTVTWDPGTVACTRDDTGPVAVGAQWTNTSEFRGREVALTYRLVELSETRVRFEGVGRGAATSDDFTVAAAKVGGSRIDYTAAITLRTWRKVADPFLRRVYAAMGAGAVAGIKRELGGR